MAKPTGGKAKQLMSAKTSVANIKYADKPIEAKVIRDFLPPPEALAFREEGVKVTIRHDKQTVD
jgi:hypothetical protein